jgi:prephenate dehydratase
MRLGYLGPPGTFSEQALRAAAPGEDERVPFASIHATVGAVHSREVDRALVPIENALEGAVTATLDALVSHADQVTIVGEHLHRIRTALVARRPSLGLEDVAVVVSHPQPLGQCAGFLRTSLPAARLQVAASTADAVRLVAEQTDECWAALAPAEAAGVYGCAVLRDGVDDDPDNTTRFVWLAPAGTAAPAARSGQAWKTAIAFGGPGDSRPGWLVRCLSEFAFRGVNLSHITSRPRRGLIGHYTFHVDCAGAPSDAEVAEAITGLQTHCDEVRVLGGYPAA